MLAWTKEFKSILDDNCIEVLMESIYVDDKRDVIKRLKHGVRYNDTTKKITYSDMDQITDIDREINNVK